LLQFLPQAVWLDLLEWQQLQSQQDTLVDFLMLFVSPSPMIERVVIAPLLGMKAGFSHLYKDKL
jgi:hypothetical protein